MRAAPVPPVSLSSGSQVAILAVLAAAALLGGCAANPSADARLDCAALQQVVKTTRADIAGLLGAKTNTRYGAVWRAKVDAYGSNCTLVGTTDIPSQYFCSIPAAADSSVLAALQADVASCVGPDWQRSPATARNGERFSRPGDVIVIDVGASDANASRADVIGLLVRRR